MKLIEESINFKGLIENLQSTDTVGFDVEGSGLDPITSTLLLIQIATPKETYVINNGTADKDMIEYILQLMENKVVIGHNIKYDIKCILHNYNLLFKKPFDTMYTESLTRPGISDKYSSLDNLIEKYCGVIIDKDVRETFIDKTDFEFTDEQIEYAAIDVEYLFDIASAQKEVIKNHDMEKVWRMEHRLLPYVAKMEYQGINFNEEKWIKLARIAEKKGREYESKTFEYIAEHFDELVPDADNALDAIEAIEIKEDLEGGNLSAKFRKEKYRNITSKEEIVSNVVPMINFASPNQAVNVLQGLGIPTDSSSEKELQRFKDHDIVNYILKYRNYYKKGHSFGQEFLDYVNDKTGRIHGELNQLGTVTGRFASSDPNLQNIIADQEYRDCFIPLDGYMFDTADYSQIELRLMAEVSNETLMIEAFQNGEDLHALTASLIFDVPLEDVTDKQRQVGKTLNFAVIYGSTEYGLHYNFGWDLDEGREYLNKFFNKYQKLDYFINKMGEEILRRGYSVNQYGRKRYFSIPRNWSGWNRFERKKKEESIKRKGINMIIQGGAAEIIKLAMLNFFTKNPFGWDKLRPLLQVHDELVVEVTEEFVYFDDEEERYKLIPEVDEFFDWCMMEPESKFFDKVPMKYDYKIAHVWKK